MNLDFPILIPSGISEGNQEPQTIFQPSQGEMVMKKLIENFIHLWKTDGILFKVGMSLIFGSCFGIIILFVHTSITHKDEQKAIHVATETIQTTIIENCIHETKMQNLSRNKPLDFNLKTCENLAKKYQVEMPDFTWSQDKEPSPEEKAYDEIIDSCINTIKWMHLLDKKSKDHVAIVCAGLAWRNEYATTDQYEQLRQFKKKRDMLLTVNQEAASSTAGQLHAKIMLDCANLIKSHGLTSNGLAKEVALVCYQLAVKFGVELPPEMPELDLTLFHKTNNAIAVQPEHPTP